MAVRPSSSGEPGRSPNDQRFDPQWQLVGVPIGAARAIGEPLHPAVAITLQDFVAGLARDRELLAQPRQRFTIQHPRDELHPLVYDVTLLPRHLCSPAKGQKCHPCLQYEMSPLSQEGQATISIGWKIGRGRAGDAKFIDATPAARDWLRASTPPRSRRSRMHWRGRGSPPRFFDPAQSSSKRPA